MNIYPFLADQSGVLWGGGILILAFFLFFVLIVRYISLWFQAFVSGAPISLFNIIGMSMRKIPPRIIVGTMINLTKAGIKQV
ncbi:MAG: hypothetical protein K1000chlam3_01462, partial [Chlamydiae bacterium]|nr:hypothetical protein [Chlamydiota bacterium]